MPSCDSPRPTGVAVCIAGEARRLAHGPAESMRANLIDGLGNVAAVFAVLSIRAGCGGVTEGMGGTIGGGGPGAGRRAARRLDTRREGDKGACGTSTTLANLGDALARLNATDVRITVSDTQMVAPVHGCAYGPRRSTSGYWQWKNVAASFAMARAYEAEHCVRFSHVVRIRPDLFVTMPLPPISTFSSSAVTVPFLSRMGGGTSSSQGWMDDRFAVVPRRFADVYFNTIQSYFTCRKCQHYVDSCGIFGGGCTDELHMAGAQALHVMDAEAHRAARKYHVGSECLIGTWLIDNHVPVELHSKGSLSTHFTHNYGDGPEPGGIRRAPNQARPIMRSAFRPIARGGQAPARVRGPR